MLQVNLLPDIKKELLHAKRTRNLVMTICLFVSIGAGGIVFLMGIFMGGLAIQKGMLIGSVDEKIAEIEKVKATGQLGEYLSVQNSLNQINAIKESQPQLSRMIDYLEVVFGRNKAISGLRWSDWQGIKISTLDMTNGVSIELTGQVDSTKSRLMLRNRLYYAMVKYSEYLVNGSGTVIEGDVRTDQKLFPNMVPTIDFEGGQQDETNHRWPFKATLFFNPIVFQSKYRIQSIEIDNCKVWSATYGTLGKDCQGKVSDAELPPEEEPEQGGGGA
ncbi:MAG: hypothetical protein LBQ11_02775 [Candidatus Nomurabacteria bacterium]|jgi:hypothetical protein|nr:hypothetical protein [Candidatus Nomurabacteria bacterium]